MKIVVMTIFGGKTQLSCKTFQKLTLTQICLIEGQSHGQVFFYCKKDVEIKFGFEGFIFARLVTFYVHRTFKKTFLEVSSKSAKL